MDKRLGIRLFWLVTGLLALGLGILGAVLPLLPTTPFLLVAAFAFARSSPRLAAWLEAHPQFGPLVANWRDHGAIGRRAKIAAMAVIVATPLVSLALGIPPWILAVQIVVLTLVSAFILSRPDGPGGGTAL
ncbi:YbaN family protein [Parasphingopyxis algicola]|uniref:YbaN family protein n=1 Tax=Parasphingopyxis algicola TaxID=2026624 RepID=UPI001FEC1757|nr:YbaN family protein [Parasphingopyxis algicola]